MNTTAAVGLLVATLMRCSLACSRQEAKVQTSTNRPAPIKIASAPKFKHPSFSFVRIRYSEGRPGRASGWSTDYPEADTNFSARFKRETGLACEPKGRVMTLMNSELSQFPFIYIAKGDVSISMMRKSPVCGTTCWAADF